MLTRDLNENKKKRSLIAYYKTKLNTQRTCYVEKENDL